MPRTTTYRPPVPPPTRSRRGFASSLVNGLMTVPAAAVYTGLTVVPVGFAVYYSFTQYNGIPSQPPTWVGLENYARIVQDPIGDLRPAVWVTTLIAVVGAFLVNAAALGLALLLRRTTPFNTFARVVMFYPHVLSALIVGFLWQAILGPQGAVNNLLESTGQSSLPFLADPDWALATLIAVIVWAQFGVQLVLYLAGLQAVLLVLVAGILSFTIIALRRRAEEGAEAVG